MLCSHLCTEQHCVPSFKCQPEAFLSCGYSLNLFVYITTLGRGRAKDSKCILVTSKSEQAEMEQNNMLKEMMMNKAIEKLQKWDEATLAQKVNTLFSFFF